VQLPTQFITGIKQTIQSHMLGPLRLTLMVFINI